MKLTFTTSLLLLSAATASSTNGGGLRSRRLSLFADSAPVASEQKISSAKADKGEKKKKEEEGKGSGKKKEDKGKGSGKSSSSKAEKKTGNMIGGSKGAKSANMKVEKGRPASGINTEDEVYYFGESIQGTFELSSQATERRLQEVMEEAVLEETALGEDIVGEEESQVEIVMNDPEESTTTDVGKVQLHLYQYMGRPNCESGTDPILSVDVTTTVAEDGSTVGSFSMATTEALRDSGIGYDLFVMDESGCNVLLGPEAVTVTLSPEEQAAEDAAAEEEAKKDKTAMGKSQKERVSKKKTYKKKEKKVDSKSVTISSKEALSEEAYEMTTDKDEYEADDLILVNYSITAAPEATAEGRRLKQRKNKNKNKEDQPEPESEPEPIVVTDEPAEDLPAAPVVDQPEPELQPDPLDSEEEEDEEGEQQPDLLPADLAIEEETEIDSTDITTYRLGVFMKMANPQGGKLPPLHEVPLCASESCTAEEVSSGTITISAVDIDTDKYGNGFDLWLLDAGGDGMAGPVNFVIDV